MIKYATLQAAQEGKIAPWDLEVPELSTQHVTVFRDRFPVTKEIGRASCRERVYCTV
jgi:hypothetical protein